MLSVFLGVALQLEFGLSKYYLNVLGFKFWGSFYLYFIFDWILDELALQMPWSTGLQEFKMQTVEHENILAWNCYKFLTLLLRPFPIYILRPDILKDPQGIYDRAVIYNERHHFGHFSYNANI